MPRDVIALPRAAAPIAPFSAAVRADGILYVSGTLPFDDRNEVVQYITSGRLDDRPNAKKVS